MKHFAIAALLAPNIIEAHWEIRPEGYPAKQEGYTSNLFRVLPKGSQLYITPEQSQKLKELPAP